MGSLERFGLAATFHNRSSANSLDHDGIRSIVSGIVSTSSSHRGPQVQQTPAATGTVQLQTSAWNSQWFYGDQKTGGRPVGPCAFALLRQLWRNGQIDEGTLVWCKGMKKQEKLADISGMLELLEAPEERSTLEGTGRKFNLLSKPASKRLPSARSILKGRSSNDVERLDSEDSEEDRRRDGGLVNSLAGTRKSAHDTQEMEDEIRDLKSKLEEVIAENESLKMHGGEAGGGRRLATELERISSQASQLQRHNDELVELLALRRDQDAEAGGDPSGARVAALISLMRRFRVSSEGIHWSAEATTLTPSDIARVRLLEANVAQLAELLEGAAEELERVGQSIAEVVKVRRRCQDLEQRCENLIFQQRNVLTSQSRLLSKVGAYGFGPNSATGRMTQGLKGPLPLSEKSKSSENRQTTTLGDENEMPDPTSPSTKRTSDDTPSPFTASVNFAVKPLANGHHGDGLQTAKANNDVAVLKSGMEHGLRREGSRIFGANLLWSPQVTMTRNAVRAGLLSQPTFDEDAEGALRSTAGAKALRDALQDVEKLSILMEPQEGGSPRARPIMRSTIVAEKRRKMASMVDKMVGIVIQRFEDNGIILPIMKVEDCIYKLGSKKLNLLVVAGKLCVKTGGGHQDFFEHLSRSRMILPNSA